VFGWRAPTVGAALRRRGDHLQVETGVDVTPLQRRPQVLAHTLVTLDRLSRTVIFVRLAHSGEFNHFGEPDTSGGALPCSDEGLNCWTSAAREKVDHQGKVLHAKG